MKLIAHRGNTSGPNTEENAPLYVEEALGKGFDVEIDIWRIGNEFFLGHNIPQYRVSLSWLEGRVDKLWIHCKNFEAMSFFATSDIFNAFMHDDDQYALTTKGYLWTYPEVYAHGVVVGWCSDYIRELK